MCGKGVTKGMATKLLGDFLFKRRFREGDGGGLVRFGDRWTGLSRGKHTANPIPWMQRDTCEPAKAGYTLRIPRRFDPSETIS